jgi:hypothetical protein
LNGETIVNALQILAISANRNVQRHINRSLASVGLDVEHCSPQWSSVSAGLNREPRMCIIDLDGQPLEEVQRVLESLASDHAETIPLLISEMPESPILQDPLLHANLNNIIAKHGGFKTGEIIDENELIVTCQKLLQRDIFGVEKYLPTWNVKIHECEVGSTEDKLEAISDLDDYLDLIDSHRGIKEAVMLVADELLMNAIYNAPRDARGLPKYEQLDRRKPLTLEPDERARFKYACDGRYIALSVADRFGSLDRDVILRYLRSCFDGGPAEISDRTAGAGLGLHMVFSSITQLTFNIEKGVSTEVIALFYARSGALAFKTSGRSLNIFYINGEGAPVSVTSAAVA